MSNIVIRSKDRKVPTKFQHLVLYAKDHAKSAEWYQRIFNLQFSARNHPDSSAAMRMIKQTMFFYSFGHYHHDIAIVKRDGVTPDNTSMLHFSLRLKPSASMDELIKKLERENVKVHEGRVLRSSKVPAENRVIHFQDPINHYWVEVLAGPEETDIDFKLTDLGDSSRINQKKIKMPDLAMPESMAKFSGLFKQRWLRELILLVPTLTGKRSYNKTEDYGVFKESKSIVSNTDQLSLYVTDLESSVEWFEVMGFSSTRICDTEAHPFEDGHTIRTAYLSLKEHNECLVLIEHRDKSGQIKAPTSKDMMHVAYEIEGNKMQDLFDYFDQNKKLGIQHNYGPAKHNNSKPHGDGESGGNVAAYYYTPDFHNMEFCTDMDCVDNYEGRYGTGARTMENDVYLVDSK